MSFGDWILLGVILLCAGAAVAHILRGKRAAAEIAGAVADAGKSEMICAGAAFAVPA